MMHHDAMADPIRNGRYRNWCNALNSSLQRQINHSIVKI